MILNDSDNTLLMERYYMHNIIIVSCVFLCM